MPKLSFSLPSDVMEIPVDSIYSDADFNCRGKFSQDSVKELAETIDSQGLLNAIHIQPITYMPGYSYRIVAGHRRHAAYKLLGRKTIPCRIMNDLSHAQALILNLMENLSREDLTIMQEATAVQRLIDAGEDTERIQKIFNKSYGWIQVRQMLLSLPKNVQDQVEAGILKQDDIRTLYQLRDNPTFQRGLISAILDARIAGHKGKIDAQAYLKRRKDEQKQRKERTMKEMGEMQDIIREGYGTNNLTTRVLGWCMGVVSRSEILDDLQEELGPTWQRPADLPIDDSSLPPDAV